MTSNVQLDRDRGDQNRTLQFQTAHMDSSMEEIERAKNIDYAGVFWFVTVSTPAGGFFCLGRIVLHKLWHEYVFRSEAMVCVDSKSMLAIMEFLDTRNQL